MVRVAASDDDIHTCTDAGTRVTFILRDGSSLLMLLSDELREVISRLNETVNLVLIFKAPAEISLPSARRFSSSVSVKMNV